MKYENFLEYDVVEIINDKESYKKNNVKKGMKGIVVSQKSLDNKWEVIFVDKTTSETIADISIDEKDMIVIFRD